MRITGAIPNHILERMSPEDRPKGTEGMTVAEADAACQYRYEKEIHEDFMKWLDYHQYCYVHSRTDKPTTQASGVPDFIVFMPQGKVVCIEFKMPGKTTSKAQDAFIERLDAVGTPIYVCQNAIRAIEFIKHRLTLCP